MRLLRSRNNITVLNVSLSWVWQNDKFKEKGNILGEVKVWFPQ